MGTDYISLKYLVDITKGKKPKYEIYEYNEGLIPYLSMDYLRGKNLSPIYVDETKDSIVKVNNDDLLILWDGSKAGEIIYGKEGALSSTMAKIEIKSPKVRKSYLTYFLIHSQPDIQGNTVGMGIPHVNGEDLKNLSVYLPSKETQIRIAEFLDKKTAEIDTIIQKKESLLLLLEEKKKAIINEAVTKGLNPNAPMKDSGIEWIGEIPEHWEVKPLGYLGSCQNGVSKGGDYFGEGHPFVNYGDIYKNYELPTTVEGLAKSSEEDREAYSVLYGDVFFTRTSETIEEIGIASTCLKTIENAVFSGFTIRFRPYSLEELYPEYSKYFFRSNYIRVSLVKEMNLVTRASLSQTLLKSLKVILPPYEEQKSIVLYFQNKFQTIDKAKEKIDVQINKLKEYRQSLISEAVIGKIDI